MQTLSPTMNTVRVAVPLFGDEVAPRFCFAELFLVADVSVGSVGPLHRLSMGDASWPQRLAQLGAAGVTVMLCGGFNRRFHPLATRYGIEVIWGLFGSAERLLQAFGDGGLDGFRLAAGALRPCAVPPRIEPRRPGGGGGPGSGRGSGAHGRRARRRRRKER